MKVLRTTFIPPEGVGNSVTTVARQRDLSISPEETMEQMRGGDFFVVFDLFEMPNSRIEVAMLKANERLDDVRKQYEINMAIAYYWAAERLRRCSKENGVLAQTQLSPLRVEHLEEVLSQLALHSNYKHQRVIMIANDATIVEMRNGKIERKTL